MYGTSTWITTPLKGYEVIYLAAHHNKLCYIATVQGVPPGDPVPGSELVLQWPVLQLQHCAGGVRGDGQCPEEDRKHTCRRPLQVLLSRHYLVQLII